MAVAVAHLTLAPSLHRASSSSHREVGASLAGDLAAFQVADQSPLEAVWVAWAEGLAVEEGPSPSLEDLLVQTAVARKQVHHLCGRCPSLISPERPAGLVEHHMASLAC